MRFRIGDNNTQTYCPIQYNPRYVYESRRKKVIGDRIAQRMQEMNLSEGELGRRSGVPQPLPISPGPGGEGEAMGIQS